MSSFVRVSAFMASLLFFGYLPITAFAYLDFNVKPYKKSSITLASENDAYVDPYLDQYYSAGNRISFTSKEWDFGAEAEDDAPGYLAWLGKISLLDSQKVTRFQISLAQEMYTPRVKKPDPLPLDHPYGGFLYLSLGAIQRSADFQEKLWVDLGVVGPASLAKDTQDLIHSIINPANNSKLPGWNTQLENEPIINLHYQITKKIYVFKTRYISSDLLLSFDFALGNGDIHAGGSSVLRLGYNLDADFGVPKIKYGYDGPPPHSDALSLYIFGGTGARIVGRNIFLEGNSFAPRSDLEINRFVYDFQFGLAAMYKGFRLAYSYTYKSREFVSQDKGAIFGSISLDISF